MTFSAHDHRCMSRALELAALGLYTTDPNPRVGCVISHGEAIVGEGWHERAGGPHAEVLALAAAGSRARGSTAYVTLEPCSHQGRTPPCAEALVAAGVARVVYAGPDPNPLVSGAGAARLEGAGIAVEAGLLAGPAAALNPGFLMRFKAGRPYVRVKLAASLDGRTALADGTSRWITGPAARADVQRLRARSSAILTSSATVRTDNPELTVRDPELVACHRPPLRVVAAGAAGVAMEARIFAGPGSSLVYAADLNAPWVGALGQRGVTVEGLPPGEAPGQVAPAALLAALAARQVNELLVEAGPTLAGALFRAGLVDEFILYLAPHLLGPGARPLLDWPRPATMAERAELKLLDLRQVGADLRLTLGPQRPGEGR